MPNMPRQSDCEALAALDRLVTAPKAEASFQHPKHLVFLRMGMNVDASIPVQNQLPDAKCAGSLSGCRVHDVSPSKRFERHSGLWRRDDCSVEAHSDDPCPLWPPTFGETITSPNRTETVPAPVRFDPDSEAREG